VSKYVLGLAALCVIIAGCGSAKPVPHSAPSQSPSHPVVTHTPVVPTSSSSSSSASIAAANAKLIVYALASESASEVSSVGSSVAGQVMPYYIRMQALWDTAYAAAGDSAQAGSVTQIPEGFQACWSGATGCQTYTGFRSDTSGRITDFLVNSQSVSSRLAIGGDSTGSGLAISSVSAYLSAQTGTVVISFRVHNVGRQTVGSVNPAFLPVFVTSDGSLFNYDNSDSVLPGPLQPGESVAVISVFDTRIITGKFSLRTNNQVDQILVSTTLLRP
jgi:hypothetical protein